jgi:hypothetical protein
MEVSGQLHVPSDLSLGKTAPSSHWIGGWVDPRTALDAVGKRKFHSPFRDYNSCSPVCIEVTILTENEAGTGIKLPNPQTQDEGRKYDSLTAVSLR